MLGVKPKSALEQTKEWSPVLAHRCTVEAYRIIERFLETSERPLKDWGALATARMPDVSRKLSVGSKYWNPDDRIGG
jgi:hypothetical protein